MAVLVLTAACGASDPLGSCDISLRADPITLEVAELTVENVGAARQMFAATVLDHEGQPFPGVVVRFGHGPEMGPVIVDAFAKTDSAGIATAPLNEVDQFAVANFNRDRQYVAWVEYQICSDVFDAGEITFAG
jgi:hypothetical protein